MPKKGEKKKRNHAARLVLLLIGIVCFCGCRKKPVEGKPTATGKPTAEPTVSLPIEGTVIPTEALVTQMPTDTKQPTKAGTPTPGGTIEPTAAVGPTGSLVPVNTPEPSAAIVPSLPPELSVTPTGAPVLPGTPIPSETPLPTREPELTDVPTPTVTTTPTVTLIPEPTEPPELLEELMPEPPLGYEGLLQAGWQRTRDFFETREIYFPGEFQTAKITSQEGRYLCEYRGNADAERVFRIEGQEFLGLLELKGRLAGEHVLEILWETENSFQYRYEISERLICTGIAYVCKNGAVMQVEMQNGAEDEKGTSEEFFYVR